MNWDDVLPPSVARKQAGFERKAAIHRMKECGFTNREVGERFGVSARFVSGITQRKAFIRCMEERGFLKVRRRAAPIEEYFEQPPILEKKPTPHLYYDPQDYRRQRARENARAKLLAKRLLQTLEDRGFCSPQA